MNINRKNYETFAADFIDGKLTPSDVAEFLAFLIENPDIANEVELLRETPVSIDAPPTKTDFSFLMKDVNQLPLRPENYDEMCIAFHEGDLNEEAVHGLFKEIEINDVLKGKFEQYKKLKLVSNENLVFANKRILKQHKINVPVLRRMAVGVCVAAAAIMGFILINTSETEFSALNKLDKVVSVLQLPASPIVEEESSVFNNDIEESRPVEQKKKIQKTVLPIVEDNVEIAKIDTTEPEEERFIRITRIEIPQIETRDYLAESTFVFPANYSRTSPSNKALTTNIRKRSNQVFAQAGNITFTDVIQTGIKGINQLAETDLKYETITNEEGKVVEFALSSESFNIRKKAKRN